MTDTVPDATTPDGSDARRIQVTTPGDWISVDPDRIRAAADDLPAATSPAMRRAFSYLKVSADALQSVPSLFTYYLLDPTNTTALATMTSFLVGGRPAEGDALLEMISAEPPPDAVTGSYQAELIEAANGTSIRVEYLARHILAVPSPDGVSLTVEYYLPLPGVADMVISQFCTPNVQQGDAYRQVFASIAESMVLV